MRLPKFITSRLIKITETRVPDEIIGHSFRSRLRDNHQPPVPSPYMKRWVLIPKNRFLNIFLHVFLRDDDDRALHCHPWIWNLSYILKNCYYEHTIAAGGVHHRDIIAEGQWKFRLGTAAHRVELCTGLCAVSLFITGPTYRMWGFHCPNGWVPHKQFGKDGGCQ